MGKMLGKSETAPLPDFDAMDPSGFYDLRLYVAGKTPKSLNAFANLKSLCEEHLAGRYSIEVIDLLVNPQLAQGDQILAIPTLVRKLPEPIKVREDIHQPLFSWRRTQHRQVQVELVNESGWAREPCRRSPVIPMGKERVNCRVRCRQGSHG